MVETIVVLTASRYEDDVGAKGGLVPTTSLLVSKALDIDVLRKGLADFAANLSGIFPTAAVPGPYALDEVRLGVEITAEGGFALLGTAKAGGKAAIELVFKRG